jgi:hypothetical protein
MGIFVFSLAHPYLQGYGKKMNKDSAGGDKMTDIDAFYPHLPGSRFRTMGGAGANMGSLAVYVNPNNNEDVLANHSIF